MASKALLFLLGLTISAVAYSAYVEAEEDDDTALTVDDFQEFFNSRTMEKRRPKVGPCTMYNGKSCAMCNLKIRNPKDTRRYIACGGKAGTGNI